MSVFVCSVCKQRVDNPYHRYERRIEFRNSHTQKSLAIMLDGHVCRGCAEEEIRERRPPKTAPAGLFEDGVA